MKDNNYIIIQGWMITQLHLSGSKLLLYALLYSFGQSNPKTGFKGMVEDLRSFCMPLIPSSSFYDAKSYLLREGLIAYIDERFFAIIPDQVHAELRDGTRDEHSESRDERAESRQAHIDNKDKKDKKGSAPQKSQFSDPNELAKRIEYRRLHGFR